MVSSNSWVSIWVGLEINLLSFIPLIVEKKNLFSSESSLKYFLIQAIASRILIFSIILFTTLSSKFLNLDLLILVLISSSLLLKVGAAPFHFWLPNVIEGLPWGTNFIILTWQKIAPILILSYCLNSLLLTFSILASVIFGSIGGLNQTSLRKIIAFSSINHLGWIITRMLYNEILWEIYFYFYLFLNLSIILIFYKKNIFNINQTFRLSSNFLKICMFLNLLSIGGLPPFLGFFPKWIIIERIVNVKRFLTLNIILFFTLIALYFYLRIAYSSLLFSNFNTNWSFKIIFCPKTFKTIFFVRFCSTFGLPLINFIFFFI